MKVGYARISTSKQNIQMQIDALEKEDCRPIYQEVMSGYKASRPEWDKCLELLREGDILVVWAIDRIGRNTRETVNRVYDLIKKGVEVRSISQGISSKTKEGRFAINMLCALAENEREMFKERSREGTKAARARGFKGGRKHKLDEKQRELVRAMHATKQYTWKEICEMNKNICKATLHNILHEKKGK